MLYIFHLLHISERSYNAHFPGLKLKVMYVCKYWFHHNFVPFSYNLKTVCLSVYALCGI